jgi:protein SCO1
MIRLPALLFVIPLLFGLAGLAGRPAAHEGHRHDSAARRSAYAFPLAPPGSYRLPPIKAAAGGFVLDESGRGHELADLLREHITLLTFIYTRCGDICPTATLDMSRLQDLAGKDRHLAGRMRLITMSFDPEHDTPEIMREHAAQWRSADPAAPGWLFLTAPNGEALAPVLAAYNQTVARKRDAASAGGPLHHIFRAFLIDRQGLIRNVYSMDFFDPDLVLNDLRTVLLEYESPLREPVDEHRR